MGNAKAEEQGTEAVTGLDLHSDLGARQSFSQKVTFKQKLMEEQEQPGKGTAWAGESKLAQAWRQAGA